MYSTGVPLALWHPHLGQINHPLPAGASVISSAGTLTVKPPRAS